MGGAYDALPELFNKRKINPQTFVDSYVETGSRLVAYRTAGGEGNDQTGTIAAADLMKMPEVQQAIAERSAQAYFELAPTAIKVIKEVLDSTDPKAMKVRAAVAMSLMDKLQVENHQRDTSKNNKQLADSHTDLAETMRSINEFIGKNPEWASKPVGRSSIIEHDEGLPSMEEHS